MLNEKEIETLNYLEQDVAIENHFFKKIKDPKWFFPLKKMGFFNKEKIIRQSTANGDDSLTPNLNILSYLERLSQQVDENDEEIIGGLLEIIKNISNYKLTNGEHLDNFRVWWSFAKILASLPKDRIPDDIINLIPKWLKSGISLAPSGSEILKNLLPKFLSAEATNEDIWKAEKIVDFVTEFKWKKGIRIFEENEEPEMLVDIHLLERAFFSKKYKGRNGENGLGSDVYCIAERIGEEGSEEIIFKIADKLKYILKRTQTKSRIQVDIDNRYFRISVVLQKDFHFNCSLGIIEKDSLAGDTEAKKLSESLTIKPTEWANFKIECRNLKCFEREMSSKIDGLEIPSNAKSELKQKIDDLYESVFDDHSSIWLIRLYPGGGSNITDPKEFIADLLKEMVLARVKKDKLFFKKVYEKFTGDCYQFAIFRRLVLFLIGEFWDSCNDYFWKILEEKKEDQIFKKSNYEPELYRMLEKNVEKLKEGQKEKLKKIIDGALSEYTVTSDQKASIYYWQQKWYSALKSDSLFKTRYEELKKKTGEEEKIGYQAPIVGWGPGSSPLSTVEILEKPNENLAEYFIKFVPGSPFGGHTIEGLLNTLHRACKEKPEKFTENLEPFFIAKYSYVSSILRGLLEAFKEKKHLNWGKLLRFIIRYIDRVEFWNDTFIDDLSSWPTDHKGIIMVAAELIEDGTRDDSWAFDEKYLPDAKKIIRMMVDKLVIEDESAEDPISHAYNSPIGRIIEALINLSLRIARIKFKNNDDAPEKWDKVLKSIYNKLLVHEIVDAYTHMGLHILNLNYLDKSWLKEKMTQFVSLGKKSLWSAFMKGYLRISKINKGQYKLMQNHYRRALNFELKAEDEQLLIGHIALGYLMKQEELSSGGCLTMLLDSWKPSQIKELIGFFYSQRDYIFDPKIGGETTDKMKRRIIEFWKWLYNKYKDIDKLSEDDKRILADSAKLAVYLNGINQENFYWLILSVSQFRDSSESYLFIEYLDRLKNKGDQIESARLIGKIFLKILENFAPEFEPEHIRALVEFLYEVGDEPTINMAHEICNIHGQISSSDFLRDIYEKNKNR